jgi:hypothetical protein
MAIFTKQMLLFLSTLGLLTELLRSELLLVSAFLPILS